VDAFRVVRSAREFLEERGYHGTALGSRADGEPRRAVVIGAGLAGLTTAMELADLGFAVDIFESRNFCGGKVGSWKDKDGNHIEMGLHVFFGCYYNLFAVMRKLGVLERHFLPKEHRHMFINRGGRVAELDFRLGSIGAPWNGLKAFFTTEQLNWMDKARNAVALGTSPIIRALLDFDGAMEQVRQLDDLSFAEWFRRHGGSRGSIERLWNPIAYALGFIDCDHISARCMLTIFQLFAVRTEASQLRLLIGAPAEYMLKPMVDYIEARGGRLHLRRGVRGLACRTDETTGEERVVGVDVRQSASAPTGEDSNATFVPADIVVAAVDVPGIQRMIHPSWCERHPYFAKIMLLETVPVITVQLRFDGWVTELADHEPNTRQARGLDNLLYSADADFSCFADLAITSPADYFRPDQGSLLQCVITPADPYLRLADAEIVAKTCAQVYELFPSARNLQCIWSSVVKLGQSLYREKPGADRFRPGQRSPIRNLYLAGSYTQQDYIDSQEGAVRSGRLAALAVVEDLLSEASTANAAEPASVTPASAR
jgi:zeta-carotene desaturase